jgi:hypothetical protein
MGTRLHAPMHDQPSGAPQAFFWSLISVLMYGIQSTRGCAEVRQHMLGGSVEPLVEQFKIIERTILIILRINMRKNL